MPRLARDKLLSLYYLDSGRGDPPVLLIHGWCCDHTYMAPQYRHLRRRHRAVAVDLRGHGRSAKHSRDFSMAAFAEDLRRLCGRLGLKRPVAIGHSMGGLIALEMAAQQPGLLAGAVLLDSPVLYPQGIQDRNRRFAQELRGGGARLAQQEYVRRLLFLPTDDPERRERIVNDMSGARPEVRSMAFDSLLAWDNLAAVGDLPVLLISAAHLLTDVRPLHEVLPNVTTAQVAGAGHFLQLEVPVQVNAMIDRFLETSMKP